MTVLLYKIAFLEDDGRLIPLFHYKQLKSVFLQQNI